VRMAASCLTPTLIPPCPAPSALVYAPAAPRPQLSHFVIKSLGCPG
jgi:hypothetical protein